MSNAAFKTVEIEETSSNTPGEIKKSKPFAVPAVRISLGNQVTRRVTEVVDYELAQGSMPA